MHDEKIYVKRSSAMTETSVRRSVSIDMLAYCSTNNANISNNANRSLVSPRRDVRHFGPKTFRH